MFDSYAYMSSETRRLAFCKEAEHSTWQDTLKQQRKTESAYCRGMYTRYDFLSNLARALLFRFNQWKQAHRPSSGLVTHIPTQRKAG